MSAVCVPEPGKTTSVNSVRWSQPPLTFELQSSDAALLQKAAVLFHRWRCVDPVASWQCWRVEPSENVLSGRSVAWEIRSSAEPQVLLKDTPARALMTVEFLAIQALLAHPQSPLALHSALVTKNGKGIALLGPNAAGKSTLACAFWQQGWSLLCDDVVLVEKSGAARPTPRRVSLRLPSRVLLGEDLWTRIVASPSYDQTDEGGLFHPHEIDGREQPPLTQLAALIFLARRGAACAPASLHRLEPAHALLALLPYSNFVRTYGPGEALRRMQPLAAAVPAYDLGRGPLSDMIRTVERVIDRSV